MTTVRKVFVTFFCFIAFNFYKAWFFSMHSLLPVIYIHPFWRFSHLAISVNPIGYFPSRYGIDINMSRFVMFCFSAVTTSLNSTPDNKQKIEVCMFFSFSPPTKILKCCHCCIYNLYFSVEIYYVEHCKRP